jgi:hypothetical protein
MAQHYKYLITWCIILHNACHTQVCIDLLAHHLCFLFSSCFVVTSKTWFRNYICEGSSETIRCHHSMSTHSTWRPLAVSITLSIGAELAHSEWAVLADQLAALCHPSTHCYLLTSMYRTSCRLYLLCLMYITITWNTYVILMHTSSGVLSLACASLDEWV